MNLKIQTRLHKTITKKICLALLLLGASAKINAQDCSGLKQGTFEASIESDPEKIRVERYGTYQLETSKTTGAVYLLEIIGTGCEYRLKFVKVIAAGNLPMPPAGLEVNVKVKRNEKKEYYYSCEVGGTDYVMNGKYTKMSDEITPEFKKILDEMK